ncbi:MAG TPA: anti-phage dCTP deaminase [Rhizomicrobium sp.]|nr:anti-phage dCTP deaminase [Rhizomicrobium sp.]
MIQEHVANEVIFGIVGHVGAGNTEIAQALKEVLEAQTSGGQKFAVTIIKARSVIEESMKQLGTPIATTPGQKLLADVEKYQNAGDKLRETDLAAVARGAVALIRRGRATMQGGVAEPEKPVIPDGRPRAFIIDSVRHPAEVGLLRRIYGDAFVLIGVVCEQEERLRRISNKYQDAGALAAERFMKRDSKAPEKNGQRVSDAFHLSDFFVDNTEKRILKDNKANPKWEVSQDLARLARLVTHAAVARPTTAETAMHAAAGAAMRSACLSRQVGAALVDHNGNLISTGTNEVPKAGGGVYGSGFDENVDDQRCAYGNGYCSNTTNQKEIAETLLADILGDDPRLKDADFKTEALKRVRDGRIGDLLEFSRAVHAEMDALLSAGRMGASTTATRLFVTTFPCHYCARHIVSAGVDEVQFIEPYPKSQALTLHKDSIQFEIGSDGWTPPSEVSEALDHTGKKAEKRVLFRPFTGVAPRMYRRAFEKDRELKDPLSGALQVQDPDWGTPYDLSTKSYAELETALTKDIMI